MKNFLVAVLLAVSISVVTGCEDYSYGTHEVEWTGGSCTGELLVNPGRIYYIVCRDGTVVKNLTNFKVVK